jgi:hypothetical protein
MKSKILSAICLLLVSYCYSQQSCYKAYESGFARLKGIPQVMTDIQWMKSKAIIVLDKERIIIYPDKNQPGKKVVYKIDLLKKGNTSETQVLTFRGTNSSGKYIITFERVANDKTPHQLRIFSNVMVYIYNVMELAV